MKFDSRIILALDVAERRKAADIVDAVRNHIDAVKVNYPFALGCGMDAVRDLAAKADVICDFKVADIPNTDRLIVEQVRKSGVRGIICHAFPGKDSLEACVAAAGDMDVYVVTEMSHPGASQFMMPVAEDMARLAVDVGAAGIIAPATRPEKVAALRKTVGNLKILSPGVGAQGGSASGAILAGADYIIVGRSIYEAKDPEAAAAKLAEEVRSALA